MSSVSGTISVTCMSPKLKTTYKYIEREEMWSLKPLNQVMPDLWRWPLGNSFPVPGKINCLLPLWGGLSRWCCKSVNTGGSLMTRPPPSSENQRDAVMATLAVTSIFSGSVGVVLVFGACPLSSWHCNTAAQLLVFSCHAPAIRFSDLLFKEFTTNL